MPIKRKKKKSKKPKKYKVTISRKQYELLKLHSSYTGKSPGLIINKAVFLYLKTVSNELSYWKKINPTNSSICSESSSKQLEFGF